MPPDPLPPTAKKNIDAIAGIERQLHHRRTAAERVGDRVARFFGSPWFIAAQITFIATWVAANAGWVPGVTPFDPYPFNFVNLLITIEFIVLTTFVLMNQNTQARRQEQWGHLTLQVCLLTEQEVTKTMQAIHAVSRHLGLEAADQEAKDMAQATPVTALVEEIEKSR